MKRSIIYVNFAPYENAGRILDFLLKRFRLVILFSFNFHKLNDTNQSNYIRIYQDGKIQKERKLFELPTPEALLFLTLPLIMFLIALQTIWHILKLKKHYGRFEYYLTVNAFTAWLGNLLRSLQVVTTTIFWVWDYYPPGYPDWRIRLARWGYWQFDRWSTTGASSVIFLNKRLMELRQKIGVLPKRKKYPIVPIGTNPGQIVYSRRKIIGHLGVLKQSQGLDFLFDAYPEILKKIPDLKVEIVGSGPDEAHFKERAKNFPGLVKFYGFVKEEDRVDTIIRSWRAGIATYVPDKSNPAFWTDPSKMKAYISQGVPVVTTAIAPFSEEINIHQAGRVVTYGQITDLVEAIDSLLKESKAYKARAFDLAKRYEYQKLYPKLFKQ